MLVLTRGLGERIIVGETISITVVRIDNGQVRLGIDAPAEVNIRREELPPLGTRRAAGAAEGGAA